MCCRQSTVPWCLKFIPISCMGPRNSPRTHIWFFNQFICTGAYACSSNLNYAHKMPGKPSKCIKISKWTPKIPKFNITLLLFYVDTRIFLKAIRGNISFRPQRWHVPYRNHHACCEKLVPKPAPNGTNFFTTACWCRSMIECQVSWISDEFLIY